jgi:hypothetical protein
MSALSDERLLFVVREDFDIGASFSHGIDVVFSNAAFEHFDKVEAVVRGLSKAVAKGGVIIAEIDLQTHSRWIRDADPNNIYRYPDWLYNMFRFAGAPNRLRPADYRAYFESSGWTDVEIRPANVLGEEFMSRQVHPRFRSGQMNWLSMTLCARKA